MTPQTEPQVTVGHRTIFDQTIPSIQKYPYRS